MADPVPADLPPGLAHPAGWTPGRLAAAAAVAGPNDQRIAAAAARLLQPGEAPEDFAPWCEAQAQPGPGD